MRNALAPIAVVAALCLTAGADPALASPADDSSVLYEVVAAVAPSAVEDAAAVLPSMSGEDAMSVDVEDVEITVPVDPASGIDIVSEGATVGIGLPFDAVAGNAVAESEGIVSYDNGNESSTVPIVKSSGAVQIVTVLAGPDAPSRYAYTLDLPVGASITEREGRVLVDSVDGDPLGSFAVPWALDAEGAAIPTHYEVSGATITQVLELGPDVAYPVVADPEYWPASTTYWSRNQVESAWKVLSFQSAVCKLPIPSALIAVCYNPATQTEAIASAHYQKKRIKQVYYGCKSGAYCSYNVYYVVS